MHSFGTPKGAEPAPTAQLCAPTTVESLPVWLLAAMAGLVLLAGMMLAPLARADDENVFADLIPGEQLEEAELDQFHGRGVSTRGLSRLSCCSGASARSVLDRLLRGRALKPTTGAAGKAPRVGGTTFSMGGTRMPQAPRTDVRNSNGDRGVGGLAHSIGLARSLSGRDYGP